MNAPASIGAVERPLNLGVPLAVYYEHPRWFEPLFAELDRRGVLALVAAGLALRLGRLSGR